VSRLAVVLREGLVFGVIAGVFAVVVRLVAVFATNDITPTALSDFVTSALGLLIVGGAARKLAGTTGEATPGLQMGAIAGGVSELMRTVVAAIILSYLPVGQAAFNRLSPAAQRAASDTQTLIVNLSLDLALAIIFGALIGWLGAWSLLRFRPPRDPKA
jgi:F0F1-type ATP synthase assembly protein I